VLPAESDFTHTKVLALLAVMQTAQCVVLRRLAKVVKINMF